LQTLKAIGKDYGLSEDIIEGIFKGEYEWEQYYSKKDCNW
jgi:hypothetical protein